MRKLISLSTAGAIMAGLCLGLSGCAEEASDTTKRVVKTPGGTETTTVKTSVEKSGSNPPSTTNKTP